MVWMLPADGIVRQSQTLSFPVRRCSEYPTGRRGERHLSTLEPPNSAVHYMCPAHRTGPQQRHGTRQCVDSADTPNHRGNSADNHHLDRLRADAAGSSFPVSMHAKHQASPSL
ncbi:hypothetical protein MLPM_0957 [Mycobacterium lepromatosis]|uniref:Uncharacterized protein n=1 Tax=Mycobacterium lepromatosis TaxID=480418 RepID=A0A0F4ER05_9MYCO|nr:hypothetical protein MLPM_0957 [Mycobacterium lepromatosis]